jgi:hypothetical protein
MPITVEGLHADAISMELAARGIGSQTINSADSTRIVPLDQKKIAETRELLAQLGFKIIE